MQPVPAVVRSQDGDDVRKIGLRCIHGDDIARGVRHGLRQLHDTLDFRGALVRGGLQLVQQPPAQQQQQTRQPQRQQQQQQLAPLEQIQPSLREKSRPTRD